MNVEILTLRDQIDLDLDASEFSVPIQLSFALGFESKNVTFIQDTIPPFIQFRQLTPFEGKTKPFATVEMEFSERVFPMDSKKLEMCSVDLHRLGMDYSALDLIQDSEPCREDLSLRSMDHVIDVVGAQRSKLQSMNENQRVFVFDVFPKANQETIVNVLVKKGSISDYSGNLNSEGAQLILHYKPSNSSDDSERQDSSDPDLDISRRVHWTGCRITGVVVHSFSIFILCLGIIFTASKTFLKFENDLGTEKQRREMQRFEFSFEGFNEGICFVFVLQTLSLHKWLLRDRPWLCFVEFTDAFRWWMLDGPAFLQDAFDCPVWRLHPTADLDGR